MPIWNSSSPARLLRTDEAALVCDRGAGVAVGGCVRTSDGRTDHRHGRTEDSARLAHIWTDTNSYLVAVHVQDPAGAPDFDPFSPPLMDDFAVVLR